jgi:predicted metal-dependent phosphoesterase TrpH
LYRYDFHVHASERSECANISEMDQIKDAINSGLSGIAFTDHHKLMAPAQLDQLNQKFAPFKIFNGIEISCDEEDWLVYGIYDRQLEQQIWTYPDLYKFVREHNGLIVLAHPFRYQPTINVDITSFPPDGIEIHSRNTPVAYEGKISAIARSNHMLTFTNSDAHSSGDIGKYWNLLPEEIVDDRDLVTVYQR